MQTWVRKTLSVGVLAAGALLFAPGGAAQADVRQSNGDNNGTQAYLPISVPLNILGNSAAIAGEANSAAAGVNSVHSGRRTESAHTTEGGWGGDSGQFNGDNSGLLNGTQLYAPISLPINLCGNSLGLLGQASSVAGCSNNVVGDDFAGGGHGHRHGHHRHGHGLPGDAGNLGDNGNHGNLGDHGNKGHHGHQGQNAGDNGDQTPGYLGDNGTKPTTKPTGDGSSDGGYGNGTKPATNAGYGATKPATNAGNGTKPATNAGYGATKPASNDAGYTKGGDKGNKADQGSKGYPGRGKSDTEAAPVSSLTGTAGGMGDNSGLAGLGLLNTLR